LAGVPFALYVLLRLKHLIQLFEREAFERGDDGVGLRDKFRRIAVEKIL
jgi:hypothetical protein